jgi:hypothetical protein
MGRIFISYRRNDTEGEAGRLADALEQEFGQNSVFLDVNAIELGRNFPNQILREIDGCSVLLAVIGPNWGAPREDTVTTRGHKRTDYVDLEISWAMQRRLRVIPVLVRKAEMPPSRLLPEEIKPLTVRNAVRLRHEHWKADVQDLVMALRSMLGSAMEKISEEEMDAAMQLDTSETPALATPIPTNPSRGRHMFEFLFAAIVLMLILYFAVLRSSPPEQSQHSPTPAKRVDLKPKKSQ